MNTYGKELIIDLHECNPDKFTRHHINKFFKSLCKKIDMVPCKLCWWDYKGYPEEFKNAPPHLKGITAVQFISTSNITIHALNDLKTVYLNIFSCKDFDVIKATHFCSGYFEAIVYGSKLIKRG